MGFPNVDLILRDLFVASFEEAKTRPEEVVADLFSDRSEAEQMDIVAYLVGRQYVGSVKDRDTGKRVYILPHFPSSELPFPQVGISHGDVDSTDRFVGDYTGTAVPIPATGTPTHWLIEYGYYERSSWNIDVVAATKEEAIWLSRFCQYFVCQSLLDLGQKGIHEVDITPTDIRIEEGTMQPISAFVRRVRVIAKTANTWRKRIDAYTYETGINTALQGG